MDTSRICFNRHEHGLKSRLDMKENTKNLIDNLDLGPLFCGHRSKFGEYIFLQINHLSNNNEVTL